APFGNVGRNRYCGASKLRDEPELLLGRKRPRDAVDLDDDPHGKLPCIEIAVLPEARRGRFRHASQYRNSVIRASFARRPPPSAPRPPPAPQISVRRNRLPAQSPMTTTRHSHAPPTSRSNVLSLADARGRGSVRKPRVRRIARQRRQDRRTR